MNYGRVVHTLGTFVVALSLALLAPAAWAVLGGESAEMPAFLVPLGLGLAVGLALRRISRHAPRQIHRREGFLIVSGGLILAALLGAVPYLWSGGIPEFEAAVFESLSGFTAFGGTVLPELGRLPRSLLLWRALTGWLGGFGAIVLFAALFPGLGIAARTKFQFETSSADREDLRPRLRETVRALTRIYAAFTALMIIVLLALGARPFDALLHAFGTVSTSGFSGSEGTARLLGAPGVALATMIFMGLAGTNFTLYFRTRREGPGVFGRDPEFLTYGGLLLTAGLGATIVLSVSGRAPDFGTAARDGFFQVVSIGTSTGFTTADFDHWPDGLRFLLVGLMVIGGCAGSASGGLKAIRVLLMARCVAQEARHFVRPHRTSAVMTGGQPVPPEVIRSALAFFAAVVGLLLLGSLGLCALGLDFVTALGSAASAFGCVGPGLGATGPGHTFAEVPGGGKAVLGLLMLLGRLEVFGFAVVFMPSLYKD